MLDTKEARLMKKREDRNWGWYIECISNYGLKTIGVCIFSLLLFYALRYTHFMIPLEAERSNILKDNLWHNIMAIIVFLLILFLLYVLDAKIGDRAKKILSYVSLSCAMLFIMTAGFWWIHSAIRIPESDQAIVYGFASYFIDGQYSFLNTEGGYFGTYPHQLPLVALMEGFFRIVGPLNYQAYQTLNVLFITATVFLLWMCVREITKSMPVSVICSILSANCFPLFFYSSWVYGEIPSLFFTFLGAWMLIKYANTTRIGWLFGVVFSLGMAVATRKNAIIFVVAFCIISIIYAICRKNIPILIAALGAIVLPTMIYLGVYKMYEVRSGYEHSSGMPASMFIEMGLHENNGCYGWYDNCVLELAKEVNYDWDEAGRIARERIVADLTVFKSDLSYAGVFFREKILSQWNNPLYQSLFFSANYRPENVPSEGTLVYKVSHDYFMNILEYQNYIQLIVFLGVVLYYLFAIKRKNNILQQFFSVALIGGFLFCILWEGKSRYMFPYYVSMFPLAVIGYHSLAEIIMAQKIKRKG